MLLAIDLQMTELVDFRRHWLTWTRKKCGKRKKLKLYVCVCVCVCYQWQCSEDKFVAQWQKTTKELRSALHGIRRVHQILWKILIDQGLFVNQSQVNVWAKTESHFNICPKNKEKERKNACTKTKTYQLTAAWICCQIPNTNIPILVPWY